MPAKFSERIIICNWNYRGDRIIKELHSPQAVPDCPIVVLTERKIETNQYYKLKPYQNVTFIHGVPMDKKVLEFVNAHQARSIIILADDDSPEPDSKSVLIALAINKLYEKKAKEDPSLRRPHISAESKNHRKIEHLKDAGVNEVVCAVDYGLGVLAQSAIVENISIIYDNLLRYSTDTNEVYILAPPTDHKPDIPKKVWEKCFLGKSFGNASEMLASYRHELPSIILIGVMREDKMFINPSSDKNHTRYFDMFKEGDKPILIAYEKPNFELLEEKI